MALVKRQSASSKPIIIGIVVILVGGIGYFLFQKFYLNAGTTNTSNTSSSTSKVITNFGESILEEPKFTELESLTVNTSVNINAAGQAQPFQ